MIAPLARPAGPPDWLLSALGPAPSAEFDTRSYALDADDPAAVAGARSAATAALLAWGATALESDAHLVISELATNAIRHAGGPIRLRLAYRAPYLVCAVSDPCRSLPVMTEPDYLAESGRGLHLIDALSAAWGWFLLPQGGKIVWATLHAE